MKEQLEQRLKELKADFETGRKMLDELKLKETQYRKSLLRISGAIQVLQEELARQPAQSEKKSVMQNNGVDEKVKASIPVT
jgi:hypothetical protein